jgi:hypothetical protein
VVFRHDGNTWQRIAFDALPYEFTTVNVVKRIRGIDVENLVKARQVNAEQVAALNAGLERPEARTILREAAPSSRGLPPCEVVVRYKCGWGAPGEFNRQYFENSCK